MNPLKVALGIIPEKPMRVIPKRIPSGVTRTGTCNFVDKQAALRYYRTTLDDINRKLKDGEIRIGRPKDRHGFRIVLNPAEGRYEMVG